MGTIEFLKERGPALLSSREAAKILGCHQETVYRWVKSGCLSHLRVGARLKFDPAQIIAYLERRTV
jgi:excisionase family DNA binding protein